MIHLKRFITALMVSIVLTGTVPSASAHNRFNPKYADELNSCVTAVSQEIDLNGVNRVRHILTKINARSLGYALTLQTSTYSENTEREYTVYCFVNGKNRPFELRVTERTG